MFKVMMAAALVALVCLGSVVRGVAQGGAGRPFITKWQGKAGEALKLPIVGTDYKLVIKNEKGEVVKTEEKVTVTGEGGAYYHPFTPTADGLYTVEAGPEGMKYMRMEAAWDSKEDRYILFTSNDKLLEVVQFGTVAWESMTQMFRKCEKMTFASGIDIPDLTKVTDMSGMFNGCSAFNQPLNHWDVSQVTDISDMFEGCSAFNQPLEKWVVSQVTNMSWMFRDCSAFNQPLEKWDVCKVTNMHQMFFGCSAFNQPLEKWDVSQVTDMSGMFMDCSTFNQPLNNWDVSQVTDMSAMLRGCRAFNQPLEKWDVSKVTYMADMFAYSPSFNQPLEKWEVSNVSNMAQMFLGSLAFNQPLEKWDVSKVTNMSWMFSGSLAFNQPLEKWDVCKVTNMREMFSGCSAFNQPLEKWDVSKVTNMSSMFKGCKSFNQPLGAWKLQTAIGGLSTTAMSVENYSQSLIGWAKQTDGAPYIQFGEEVKGLIYNDAGKEAREKLIARGWIFEGDIFYQLSEKVAITLAKEGEGTLAIEGYNDAALRAVTKRTELTVIATPKAGYTLTSLTAGTQDIFATKKFTVTEAVTVKAVFKKTVAISLAKEGEGTLAIEGYNDEALKAVAIGTELTVIATPKAGYTLTSLMAGTQNIFATKKFVVTKAMEVKAVFKKTVAISLAKEGEGTLAIEGYNDEALKAVAVGTALTVIATPKEGYKFTSLMAGTQNIFATKKFTVTEAVTVKAVFKKKENNGGGNNGGNNGGGNNGGGWQPQTPKAVEDAVLASLTVAPNPFTAQLRISNPSGVTATYELVTLSGAVVRSGLLKGDEVFVATEALPAGIYFVRIEAQNGAKRVVKVVKY